MCANDNSLKAAVKSKISFWNFLDAETFSNSLSDSRCAKIELLC